MVKSVKENMRNERESEVVKASRKEYSKKLGTIPRVPALSCGAGDQAVVLQFTGHGSRKMAGLW